MRFNLSEVDVRPLRVSDTQAAYEEYGISRDFPERDGLTIIGAFWENEMIGVISVHNYTPGKCNLLKLTVAPMFRHHGVGKTLMREAELFCKDIDCKLMRCETDDDMSGFHFVMKILSEHRWNNLGIKYYYTRIRISNTCDTFIYKHSKDPYSVHIPGLSIRRFSQVSTAERQSVEWYPSLPESLRPIWDRHDVISDLSMALLTGERVIGWVSVTARTEEEICVENIYVSEEYRKNAYGLILYEVLYWKILSYPDPKLQYLSYYTDNEDKYIKKLYGLLVGESVDKRVNHYILEKAI